LQIERMRHERVPVSDLTRALLCSFAAADIQRPLPRGEADWQEVFSGVCRNGLLGLTQRYLRHQEAQDFPPPEFRQWVQDAYCESTMDMLHTYGTLGQVLAHLARSGLDYMVLKGPAVAHMVYPDPFLRSFNDLDLMVREQDWALMHKALLEMGFRPERDQPEAPPRLVPQARLEHFQYWHTEPDLLIEMHYDDFLHAGLASRDVEGFWQRAVWLDIGSARVKTLSLEDQLIYACAHAHHHSYTRLVSLTDIAFIVRDHAAQLDWDGLLRTVRSEEAQVAVYYSLYFLERLLGVDAPEDVLAAVQPDSFRRWAHERYMPEGAVLSLQPMPEFCFSFYFRPFVRRLLPDLLVMGRRSDKLRYLLRLLAPPRNWLIHHYALKRPWYVLLHYLLHPLKFFYHVVTDVLRAVILAILRPLRPTI
jgi:hypothetical protein